jgi:cell division transport system ATP-binding protein
MIVFDKVSKKFFNDTYGVKKVDFEVEPGEILLITGPTGSGKTTLMRLITREYEPDEGQILFDDLPLSELSTSSLHQHRRRIGVVFQDYRLLPESNVWENIALPLLIAGRSEEKIEERITDLLKLVNLENKADLFPRELSGGEAQRVSIARALATAPPVLFADEPTGNLDKDTTKSIIKLLKKINELGTTVLLSTHDIIVLEDMKSARRLDLKDGELVLDTKEKKKKPIKEMPKKKKVGKESLKEKVEDLKETTPKTRFKFPFKKFMLKKKKELEK